MCVNYLVIQFSETVVNQKSWILYRRLKLITKLQSFQCLDATQGKNMEKNWDVYILQLPDIANSLVPIHRDIAWQASSVLSYPRHQSVTDIEVPILKWIKSTIAQELCSQFCGETTHITNMESNGRKHLLQQWKANMWK